MTGPRRQSLPQPGAHRLPRLLGSVMIAAVLVGCAPASTGADGAAPTTPSPAPPSRPAPAASPRTPPPPTLPAAPAWNAGPGEVQPEIKLTATRLVETVGTWQRREEDQAAVARRLSAAGLDPSLAEQVPELIDERAVAATTTVSYPQYGGLTATEASVMTSVTQDLLMADGERVARQATLDVRLTRASVDEPWRMTAISPDLEPPAPGGMTPRAQKVLDSPNVRLPGTAERDIEEGRIDAALLTLLDGLGRAHVIDVQVLESGHPTNVFATDRASNHSRGRAVDIWRIDGHLVVDPATPRELLEQVMREGATLGATEVGGPFDLNGDRPGFFTDLVHRDHLHLGITAGRPPAQP